uniref:Reverse transcriptase domain-containing protein n=1 Tax=Tanacetum cinerariifolium TaxID=118510 RepID=A0A699JZ67_TANCI|nr:hypothetical protein [Tanacetum cinerariifolium]
MNHDSYNSNSLGFDQPQSSQSPVIHQPPQELSIQKMEDLKRQYLDELKCLSNLEYRDEIKIAELTENFNVTPVLSTEEPDNSLNPFEDFSESNEEFSSTGDDSFSFDKIDYVEASPLDSELVSSEVMEIVTPKVGGIKALNDNSTPFYDPIISGTPPNLTPSGESFFDAEYESDSSDDQSCFDEDVLEKIVSKPLFEEEIIHMKINQHPDNAESDLMESLRTHDSSLSILSKIGSLLDEFIDIRLIGKSLYDNSSPHPPKEFVSANSDAESESFSPSPILVKDSDSLMEEIDLFCTPDYPMLPGIEDKDYDSERDILILKDLPSNNTLSFAEKESFHFDIPLFSRPPAKPPDDDTEILNIKMMGDISDQKAFMHKLMITLASHQEKSPDLLSHRGLKAFQPFATCTMMIHGQNNPILDVLLFHFYPP